MYLKTLGILMPMHADAHLLKAALVARITKDVFPTDPKSDR